MESTITDSLTRSRIRVATNETRMERIVMIEQEMLAAMRAEREIGNLEWLRPNEIETEARKALYRLLMRGEYPYPRPLLLRTAP